MDEGCNSNCHGAEWAEDASRKLDLIAIKQKFDWVHKREKTYNGIGGTKVKTYGKRKKDAGCMVAKAQQKDPPRLS